MEITQEYLKQLFNYKNGCLYWKISPNPSIAIGKKAGYKKKFDNCFRNVIGFNKRQYLTSRIIFLWHKGYLPPIVDHRDRNSLNDKIENLREANKSQNNKNTNSRKNTTSKFLGVHLAKNKFWVAQIGNDGKQIQLGRFKTEIEAAKAYNEAATKYHGEFANINKFNQ